ncbi:hypothetical protein FPSE5266_01437 [Fusarium pseudograminearum]|nr:hypothetical protein FPSE5266_01437 [Fusarium pseudograminearum]
MADFAFNWQGVAYETGRQNRRQNDVAHYFDHLLSTKGRSDVLKMLTLKHLGERYCSYDELKEPNVPREHLVAVVGEILPPSISFQRLQRGQTTSLDESEFHPAHHSHIRTRTDTEFVVSKIIDNKPSFYRLIGQGPPLKFTHSLPDGDEALDRIFFYREYAKGISTTSKRERMSKLLKNIIAFNQNYLRRKDNNDWEDDNDDDEDINNYDGNNDDKYINNYEDNDDDEDQHRCFSHHGRYYHSMNSYSNHLVESETSDQLSEERDQIVHDAPPNTSLTISQPEVSNETLSLFDCLMNGPGFLAHGDTAKLLSYCKGKWELKTEEQTLMLLSVGLRQGALAGVATVIDPALYGHFTAIFCELHDDPSSGGFNNLYSNIRSAVRFASICSRTMLI